MRSKSDENFEKISGKELIYFCVFVLQNEKKEKEKEKRRMGSSMKRMIKIVDATITSFHLKFWVKIMEKSIFL